MSAVEEISNILSKFDLTSKPLMKRPTDKEIANDVYANAWKLDQLSQQLRYGRDMHTHVVNSTYGDEESWYFLKGVKSKIKDDTLYKIWYRYHDAADPMDSSCSYSVYYIEEINKERDGLIQYLEALLKELKK